LSSPAGPTACIAITEGLIDSGRGSPTTRNGALPLLNFAASVTGSCTKISFEFQP
jgi:hypothetical protein